MTDIGQTYNISDSICQTFTKCSNNHDIPWMSYVAWPVYTLYIPSILQMYSCHIQVNTVGWSESTSCQGPEHAHIDVIKIVATSHQQQGCFPLHSELSLQPWTGTAV
jgi:hypothetical protein